MRAGFVYIVTNRRDGVLYIGVTNDRSRWIADHRSGAVSSFTKKYNCHNLVWFEQFENIHDARLFERRMKSWKWAWRIKRIEELNPQWNDLTQGLHLA